MTSIFGDTLSFFGSMALFSKGTIGISFKQTDRGGICHLHIYFVLFSRFSGGKVLFSKAAIDIFLSDK